MRRVLSLTRTYVRVIFDATQPRKTVVTERRYSPNAARANLEVPGAHSRLASRSI